LRQRRREGEKEEIVLIKVLDAEIDGGWAG
jgi:hypothetical protein